MNREDLQIARIHEKVLKMEKITKPGFKLVGIQLERKTTNANGQANLDCGILWQRFEKEQIPTKIPGAMHKEVYAVYFDYDGDHTAPFAYFIGCKVAPDTEVPDGLQSITIPDQEYFKFVAKGKMPDCIGVVWKEIWESDLPRRYGYDFEVYDERSSDWENAQVDVFISV